MIPSRPLFLGDIVGISFVIAAKTWTRTAIATILFIIVPVASLYLAGNGLIGTFHEALEHEGYLTPEKLEQFRLQVVDDLTYNNPELMELYGIAESDTVSEYYLSEADYPEEDTNSIAEDTSWYEPDSDEALVHITDVDTSRIYLAAQEASFSVDADKFFDTHGNTFISYFIIIIIAYLVTFIASTGYQTVATDLACREFEERELDLRQAIKDTFWRNLWINIGQFLIFLFVLGFGIGVITQVAPFLDRTLAALLIIGGFIMTLITALRLILAQPALVSESLGALASLKRSWELTKGNVWRMLGITIVFGLICLVFYFIVTIPLSAMQGSSSNIIFDFLRGKEMTATEMFSSLEDMVVEIVLFVLVTSIAFATIGPSFLTVFYYDLRTRKEGPLTYDSDEHPTTDPGHALSI